MAKEKNGKMLRWASLIIVVGGLLAGFVAKGTVQDKDIAQTAEEVSELATDGCAPTQRHTTQIAVIQATQTTIKEDISDIKADQRAGFKAILERLPEKGE